MLWPADDPAGGGRSLGMWAETDCAGWGLRKPGGEGLPLVKPPRMDRPLHCLAKEIRNVDSTAHGQLAGQGEWLQDCQVNTVAMEATGVCGGWCHCPALTV